MARQVLIGGTSLLLLTTITFPSFAVRRAWKARSYLAGKLVASRVSKAVSILRRQEARRLARVAQITWAVPYCCQNPGPMVGSTRRYLHRRHWAGAATHRLELF